MMSLKVCHIFRTGRPTKLKLGIGLQMENDRIRNTDNRRKCRESTVLAIAHEVNYFAVDALCFILTENCSAFTLKC